VNKVELTLTDWLPLAVVTHVGYIVAFVDVSSVMAVFVALIAELQPKPVFVVQLRAEADVEHDGMLIAVTAAVPDVELPRTVFVAIVVKLLRASPVPSVREPCTCRLFTPGSEGVPPIYHPPE
jgi:hypothetical protein